MLDHVKSTFFLVNQHRTPSGFIWISLFCSVAHPAKAAMVARACEDLEPLRVAIEKAREASDVQG